MEGCLLACAAGRGPWNQHVPAPLGSCHLSVLATGTIPSLGKVHLRLSENYGWDADLHKPPCWAAKGQPLVTQFALILGT